MTVTMRNDREAQGGEAFATTRPNKYHLFLSILHIVSKNLKCGFVCDSFLPYVHRSVSCLVNHSLDVSVTYFGESEPSPSRYLLQTQVSGFPMSFRLAAEVGILH